MSNRKHNGFSAKGYYIALILCAAAIGISGYLYYQNTNEEDPQIQTPTQNGHVDVISPTEDNIQAISPQPTVQNPAPDSTTPPVTQTPVKKPLQTCLPLEGDTLTVYAMDTLCYNPTTRDWRVHDGIDIAAQAGAEVRAAAAGTVSSVYEDDIMGTTVVLQHSDGYTTVYASLASEVSVTEGDTVTLGQVIGCVGNTALLESALGDHLHFAVSCFDESVDPSVFFQLS